MSIVHLNQIKNHLLTTYEDKIDLSDVKGTQQNIENHTLSRSLSAFVINSISDSGIQKAGASVTDGSKDNGIDAIYIDTTNSVIYLVQSKWIHSGKGEPSNGDVKKFLAGIKDILNCRFSRFNNKIRDLQQELIDAMSTPTGKLICCIAYTGVNGLAEPSQRDLDDFSKEVNDVSAYLTFKNVNQQELYHFLTRSVGGAPINIDVGLKHWGTVKEPNTAYYGQVNGKELKAWWDEFGVSILTKNIRSSLGDTEVNHEIHETISTSPQKFWYYNNGITLIAKRINKTVVGGGDREYGTFRCEEVSIVNGAQTLSTLGKADTISSCNLDAVFVPVRIISLENSDNNFGEKITKSNNLQNKIESRDFVSLDPEQQRLKLELNLEGINYSIKRDSSFSSSPTSFDLSESTTALACASNDLSIIVQLKREVGRIWDDIHKPPYTSLFNKGLSATYLQRCVVISREIENHISGINNSLGVESTTTGIGIHGNRIIAGLVFSKLNQKQLKNPSTNFESFLSKIDIKEITSNCFHDVVATVESGYSSYVLPTLFKNRKKCQEIYDKCQSGNTQNSVDSEADLQQYELL